MASEVDYKDYPEEINVGRTASIRDVLIRYLINLPLFILSMVFCVGGGLYFSEVLGKSICGKFTDFSGGE